MVPARALSRHVVALLGPTAAGKSALAIELARRLPVDIISVDSAMVYRGLDIGTGKPDAAIRQRFPHALVDVREPPDVYSAGDFVTDATACIDDAHARRRLPLLVGGTMLYAKALRDGLASLPPADAALRARIAGVRAAGGNAALSKWLATVDAGAAARLHVNDSQRLARALEVALSSGRPMQDLWRVSRPARAWTWSVLWLAPPRRQALDAAIAARFGQMLEAGLEAEVAALCARPDVGPALPAMRSVGYRQVVAFLAGRCGRDEMIGSAVAATRALARRQYTWRRQFPEAVELAPGPHALERALQCLEPLSIVEAQS